MVAELGHDMAGFGRADPTGAVGRGSGDRPPSGAQQHLRHGVGGDADRHRIEPGAGQQRQPAIGAARQDQAQRTRPEMRGDVAGAGVEDGKWLGFGEARNMHDQRVEARPSFGGEDCGDGPLVSRIGAEPIDRLGWKRDEPSLAQQPGGARDRGWGGGDDPGWHRRTLPRYGGSVQPRAAAEAGAGPSALTSPEPYVDWNRSKNESNLTGEGEHQWTRGKS